MSTPGSVAFHTLGCKLNFAETSSISRSFKDIGFSIRNFEEQADFYVINTCSVTDFADRKCRQVVRQALKRNPDAKIIVIGCYAQLKPQEIAEMEGVDLVLGAAEKFNVVQYIDMLQTSTQKGLVFASEVNAANTFISSFSFGDRTRTFLKVQDGCNYKCTYCTIPQARGESRSDTIDNVLKNVDDIAAKGCKEIVLTGVNLGDFGNGTEVIEGTRPQKEAMFYDLVKELDKCQGIERFRISSNEPNLLTGEIIDFVAASTKFVPHFHIPLQSGSNKILRLMRRRYLRELYANKVAEIRNKIPDACIGVDVIVGFPGETNDDFLETYQFIKDLDVSYLHVFTFSERENTLAAEMEGVVSVEERRRRNEMLRILSEKKKRAFYDRFVGKEKDVLFEAHKDKRKLTGFTDNYLKVELEYQDNLINTIGKVKLISLNNEGDFIAERVLQQKLSVATDTISEHA